MATKQNESVQISRTAMSAFALYLASLANDTEAELQSIEATIKALADEDSPIAGSDLAQTRTMYDEIKINLVGALKKVREAATISNKFVEVQESIAGNKKRTTADYAQAAVRVARQLKAGNSLEK